MNVYQIRAKIDSTLVQNLIKIVVEREKVNERKDDEDDQDDEDG